jgi:hypothetical protein
MLLSVWRWRGEEDVMIPAAGVGANAVAVWRLTESTAVRAASVTLMFFFFFLYLR